VSARDELLVTDPYRVYSAREKYRAFAAELHPDSLPGMDMHWRNIDRFLYRTGRVRARFVVMNGGKG
jgi:hypothetical protein